MALENVGGRETYYGRLPEKNKQGAQIAATNLNKKIKYEFDYDDLPGADTGNEMVLEIPAGSQIVSSKLKVGTAWAGGTSIDIGLAQEDGTVIDADGLDAAIATASLTAGAIIEGDGALVGASVGANDAVVTVGATGSFAAGTATLIVEYIPFGDDAA